MSNIAWVRQEHARGCGLACLAMLTGLTYQEAKSAWDEQFNTTQDWESSGSINTHMDQFLVTHGLAVARLYTPAQWPLLDGLTRICQVMVVEGAPCSHFVVMLPDNTILDPLHAEPRQLSDYYQRYNVAAVVPITGRETP